MGPNGSGKTNLYRALQLLHSAATGQLGRRIAGEGGMQSILWAGGAGRVRLAARLEDYSYDVELATALGIRGCLCVPDSPRPGGRHRARARPTESRESPSTCSIVPVAAAKLANTCFGYPGYVGCFGASSHLALDEHSASAGGTCRISRTLAGFAAQAAVWPLGGSGRWRREVFDHDRLYLSVDLQSK